MPYFVVDRRYALSGAQSAELILTALERAWTDAKATASASASDGSCDDGSCDV